MIYAKRSCTVSVPASLWFALWIPLASAGESVRLDDGWKFFLGDAPLASSAVFDDSAWRQLCVPHDWSIESTVDPAAPCGTNCGFFTAGVGWYRRAINLPTNWHGKRVVVEFEGVYHRAEAWLNGERLGDHPYGYTPFEFDLTPHLRENGPNVLAVRVDNSQQPNCRWYSGSGIYRHVWLHALEPVFLTQYGTRATTLAASNESAKLELQAVVRATDRAPREATVQFEFFDSQGQTKASVEVSGQVGVRAFATNAELIVPQPALWSPESPTLYRLETRLLLDGEVADSQSKAIGIRTIEVLPERGLLLNGKPVELMGGCVHHDNGPLGAAAFDRAEERRVELLKAAGFNAIRTSHNPPSTAFLDACDRLGMLVIDEAFDGWAKAKKEFDYHVEFEEWWQRDLDAMIRRDWNHPSVIMWSIGNEVYERGDEAGYDIAQRLAERTKSLDSSRPVTIALNGLGEPEDWPKLDRVFGLLDAAGYNYELHRHEADHLRVPSRVMLSTESFQSTLFADWQAVQSQPYVVGDFVWSALDYLGEAGIGRVFPPGQEVREHWIGDHFPWHGAYCGDIDVTGWRKPISHYRNIVWNRGELLYAAVREPAPGGGEWGLTKWSLPPSLPSWNWPGAEGKQLTLDVFSRCDAVQVFLNGQLVGEKPTTESEEFRAEFSVDYRPGELKIVGLRDGEEVAMQILGTARQAAALRLGVDRSTITADGQDLAFVTVEVVDATGRLCPRSDWEIQYALAGPGVIAAVGSGDLTSQQSYQANPRRSFQGRALVVVRATKTPGEIMLTARAPNLSPVTTAITTLAAIPAGVR